VLGAVDAGQTVRLSGHVPVYADVKQLPSTALDPSAKFAHLTVVLSRAPAVEAALEQLLADQINPSSPRYHQWLTPAQVGTLYGPAQSDVDAVTLWLQSQGLTVNSVSPNRLYVDFSGPAATVETAFGTSFRVFSLANGEQRYSLLQEPTVPAALQPVVATIAGLSQVLHYSTAHKGELVQPKSGSGGEIPALNSTSGKHYLVSGDFAVAYDINPVYNSSITGTGQNIAIAGLSRVAAMDVSALETLEGAATKQPNVIIPPAGVDPGAAATATATDNGDQDEATLDVDRTISTAPGATVDQVISANVGTGNTYATDGLYIAINYAVSAVNDPILTISYGGCEYLNGQANDTYEASIFQTAASQGITTFISAGDSGAAACNGFYSTIPTSQVLSINDFCANQYVTCMGGTEFADTANPAAYWSASNSSTEVSLLSYIPEGAWNDVSVSNTGVYTQGATGGGTSIYLPRPTWQTGTGVPSGSFRLVPDLALTSSTHDGFVTCLAYQGATCGSFFSFGGTSAAAPSMAGIQALIDQKLGGRQGNINPAIYQLGASTTPPYHDVTVASSGVSSCVVTTPSLCNNSTPTSSSLTGGLAGYLVNAGWDESTGWGSVDVAKYMASVTAIPAFSISPASGTVAAAASSSKTDLLTLTSVNSFSGAAALTCSVLTSSGSATGTCSVSPASVTLAANGTGSSTLTVNTGAAAGTLNVVITGVSGTTTEYANVVVTVGASTTPTFSIAPSPTALTFTSGATSGNSTSLVLSSLNSFAGTVALSCTISTTSAVFQPTCAVSPSSVALASGGTGNATLTIGSTTARNAAQKTGLSTASNRWSLGGGAALALLLFCAPLGKRRRAFGTLATTGLLALGLSMVSGCSSSSGNSVPVIESSAGTYTVTVTGTGTTTGGMTAVNTTATVTVTIN